MFGMGMPEILLILAIALIVIGPKKLPDLAKSIGRALGEFKRASQELKDSFDIDPGLKDVKNAFNDIGSTDRNPTKADNAANATDADDSAEDPDMKEAKDQVNQAFGIKDADEAGDWQHAAAPETEDQATEPHDKEMKKAEGGEDDNRG